MKVTLQLPEPIGQALLGLPDRDDFASVALTRALEERRRRTDVPGDRVRGRHLSPSEAQALRLPAMKNRERELAWRQAHQEELQSRFAGQWVVLEDEEIVAAHLNAAEAAREARTKGIAVPFLFYVDKPQLGVVNLGL